MFGEQNELKSRFMLVGYADDTHTSTPTSNPFGEVSENVRRLVLAIGTEEKSVKEMMEAVGLKDRKNFLEYSLTPAIDGSLVKMKYPDSPRHPRQKYLLTVKGLAMYDRCKDNGVRKL